MYIFSAPPATPAEPVGDIDFAGSRYHHHERNRLDLVPLDLASESSCLGIGVSIVHPFSECFSHAAEQNACR
jgi:hypothetical protein